MIRFIGDAKMKGARKSIGHFLQAVSCCMLFFAHGLLAGGVDEAGGSSTNSAVTELQQLLLPMESLKGTFIQTLTDLDGDIIQESEGEFSLKRPGKFLWHTAAPFEQLLVSDNKTLWLYDPDLEQVTVRPFDQRLQQTPALLLSGNVEELENSFEITRVPTEDGKLQFLLIPRGAEKLFESLSLNFVQGKLSQMLLLDSLGQSTRFELIGVLSNPDLSDELFNFQAPEGTDVLIDE